LTQRYEKESTNPKEALSLGSVSRVIMPGYTRQVLGENLNYLIRHYKAAPMSGVQREFE
jgi:methylmalonyl-CoA decarboxylase subunit alpha